jgi:isoquinoline 1-oxidoreductase beta subunit
VISRRALLAGGAAGLTLSFAISGPRRARAAAAFEPNAWLTITPDGAVTVHITRAEMGQGIATALAQIVGEELEADWKDIRVDYPSHDPKYGPMITGGSRSINESFDVLSRAGAAARIMLIDAAATAWNVAATDCVAERGRVRHTPTGRSVSYGELVARVPITKTLTPDELKAIPLKKPAQYTMVGKSMPRLDIPEKVDGRAKFAIDVFLPGMAYAKVAYPPTREGGKPTSVDDSAARRVKGHLKTIVIDELVAVVAETYEAAVASRDALTVSWDLGPHANVSTPAIFQEYERKARQEIGERWVSIGDVPGATAKAVATHTAAYTTDFVVHAQMEPLAAVARYENGVLDIFTGTQGQTRTVRALSAGLKVDPAKIRIHQHYLGGGFGRNIEWDIELEAALIAREAGRPSKLIRSREEDFARGFYRTPTLHVITAGLDAGGRITAWDQALVGSLSARVRLSPVDARGRTPMEIRGANHLYEIPNRSVRAIPGDFGLPTGFYRSVETGYTTFAIETFLDELAHLAKIDPLRLRASMLGQTPRLTNVLRLAAARSGWGTPLAPDVGRGIACVTEPQPQFRTCTAGVVQARVDRASGAVTVEKITCVVDCGIVVSPDGARAQIEGALLFGLGTTLKEYGSVTRGAFDQKNFDDYPILRMDEVPEVDVHIVESTEVPTGVGEPPLTVVAPALSNAIFAATGARLRNLPFLPERVLKAMPAKS